MTTTVYRKNSLESKLDSMLPDWPSFDVIAHELWADGYGGYSVNASWHLGRNCTREEAITHLRHRWEIWKLNYMPKARVADLQDASCGFDEDDCLLEVDCIAFAEVRKGGRVMTTNTPWTPGPWNNDGGTIERCYHASRVVVAKIEHAPKIGTISTGREGDDREGAVAANAQLIALAPEMAKALADLACFIDSLKWGETYAGRPHAIMDKARAILARLPQKGGEK